MDLGGVHYGNIGGDAALETEAQVAAHSTHERAVRRRGDVAELYACRAALCARAHSGEPVERVHVVLMEVLIDLAELLFNSVCDSA